MFVELVYGKRNRSICGLCLSYRQFPILSLKVEQSTNIKFNSVLLIS